MKSIVLTCLLFTLGLSMAQADNMSDSNSYLQKVYLYQDKVAEYQAQGKHEIAHIYQRMGAINQRAAELAAKGQAKTMDWSEYHQLEKQLIQHRYGKRHPKQP